MTGAWGGLKAMNEIRDFLRSNAYLDELGTQVVLQALPMNWRDLAARHGASKVFDCLRDDLTIGGAKHRLIMRARAR